MESQSPNSGKKSTHRPTLFEGCHLRTIGRNPKKEPEQSLPRLLLALQHLQTPSCSAPPGKKPQVFSESKLGTGWGQTWIHRVKAKPPSMAQTSIRKLVFLFPVSRQGRVPQAPFQGLVFILEAATPARLSTLWSAWNQSVRNMLAWSYLQPAWGYLSECEDAAQTGRLPSLYSPDMRFFSSSFFLLAVD